MISGEGLGCQGHRPLIFFLIVSLLYFNLESIRKIKFWIDVILVGTFDS